MLCNLSALFPFISSCFYFLVCYNENGDRMQKTKIIEIIKSVYLNKDIELFAKEYMLKKRLLEINKNIYRYAIYYNSKDKPTILSFVVDLNNKIIDIK